MVSGPGLSHRSLSRPRRASSGTASAVGNGSQSALGTRAAGALKGMVFLLIVATLLVRILGRGESFQRLTRAAERRPSGQAPSIEARASGLACGRLKSSSRTRTRPGRSASERRKSRKTSPKPSADSASQNSRGGASAGAKTDDDEVEVRSRSNDDQEDRDEEVIVVRRPTKKQIVV